MANCWASTVPLSHSIYTSVSTFTYLYFVDNNLHDRQQVALILAVRVSWQMTTVHMDHINILEYMVSHEFQVYMDLRNQGATNAG